MAYWLEWEQGFAGYCLGQDADEFFVTEKTTKHLKSYRDVTDARGVLPMFYLELVSELRKGELVALLWSDLDIQSRPISVSKQHIKNPSGTLILSRPKTEASVRRVSIPQEAVDLLIQEYERSSHHQKCPRQNQE